jgi:hypothetical protein
MEWTDIAGYVMVFLFGLVAGRVWGGRARASGGNMLTSHLYTTAPNTTAPNTPPPPMTNGAAHTPAAPDARLMDAPGAALEAEIRQIAATGNFLHAIKVYRERTGCGLREARDAVARICGI